MKTNLRFFLLFIFVFLGQVVNAKDFEVNGIAYNVVSLSDLTCEVTRNNQYFSPSYIPAHVTYKGRTFTVLGIGDNAFDGSNVSDITFENGLTYIGKKAFFCCGFTSLVIPKSIIKIEEEAFNSCGKTQKTWNGNYISILSELRIEDSDEMLEGTFWLGNYSTFCDTKIKKLYLGRNINDAVLNDGLYTSLEELTIGDLVTELRTSSLIPDDIFDLYYLKKVTIGTGLKKIPYLAEGDELTQIYVRSTTPQASEGFNDGTYMHATLYVPKGAKEVYEAADIWKNFWSIKEYDVETTGINNVEIKQKSKKLYNLDGTNVNSSYHGVVIKNGKKYLNK